MNRARMEKLHVYYTCMARKLTIMIDDEVYDGLYRRVGRRKISRFLEDLARPHVVDSDLDAAYREMSEEESREADALEWAEGLIEDTAVEPR
jgi:hypothetical protein